MFQKLKNSVRIPKVIDRVFVVDLDQHSRILDKYPEFITSNNSLILAVGAPSSENEYLSWKSRIHKFNRGALRTVIFCSKTTVKEIADHAITAICVDALRKNSALINCEWTLITRDGSINATISVLRSMGVHRISRCFDAFDTSSQSNPWELSPHITRKISNVVDINSHPMKLVTPAKLSDVSAAVKSVGHARMGLSGKGSLKIQLQSVGYTVDGDWVRNIGAQ